MPKNGVFQHRAALIGAILLSVAVSELVFAVINRLGRRTFHAGSRVFQQVPSASKEALEGAVRDLLATQRNDGGWSDNPYMRTTAYATGEALVALHEAGLPVTDSAWKRGVEFLLKTQLVDGSWYVRSHSYGTQPYFDNGFPHGQDQWISAAATNWATMALALASGRSQLRRHFGSNQKAQYYSPVLRQPAEVSARARLWLWG